MYFRKLNARDPKSFWKAVKFLAKKPQSIPTLIQGDTTVTTDYVVGKANLLNTFHSCFNTSHPPITSHSLHNFECSEEHLCTEEVFDLLSSLDTTKASGPDELSARMLKSTVTSITTSVTKLYNLSISKCR
ncbi:MAG: hypothetical protein MJE68_13735, partial [Proteobacteria bacterium]|nr:hypothetical protein [Pseudomonadota bacterium]